ncbi:hypothetical protein SCFA_830009 [anaerobic digester metagenome]|uniref:Uncharacterized protein n=1 Tax=anaerobic digester metagenome TaxID=1263854 RepID=A0A485M4S3_9ZZZZ
MRNELTNSEFGDGFTLGRPVSRPDPALERNPPVRQKNANPQDPASVHRCLNSPLYPLLKDLKGGGHMPRRLHFSPGPRLALKGPYHWPQATGWKDEM